MFHVLSSLSFDGLRPVKSYIAFAFLGLTSTGSVAQIALPNVPQGAPGSLLAGPVEEEIGRLAVIEFLGGHIITIPESPGSESSDHTLTQAWSFANPSNPQKVAPINPSPDGDFGLTANPFLAHGSIKRDNEVYIGARGSSNSAVRLNDDGSLEHVRWSGADTPTLRDRDGNSLGVVAPWWSKGGFMRPWAMEANWAYNTNSSNTARLSLGEDVLAEWDVVSDTGGVAGFPNVMGDVLIYASDQRTRGVASYDLSDVHLNSATGKWQPRLLDVFNTPLTEGGVGGYWSEISGHYLVIARRSATSLNPDGFAGVQVIDFSDPRDLKLHCERELTNPEQGQHWTLGASPMYVGFQDNFAFIDNFKIDINDCSVELRLDTTLGTTGNTCYSGSCPDRKISTSQYSRVVGNLWVTGGYPTKPGIDGMSVWVHQSAPDTQAPYIAYHIPQVNRTNYPVNFPLSFSIPETLESTTVIVSATARGREETLTLQEVGGDTVPLDYVLSHAGMLTVEPLEILKANTTYEVKFTSGIEDAVGNAMEPYSFRFSTGDDLEAGDGTDGGTTLEPAVIDTVTVSPDERINLNETLFVDVSSANADEYQLYLDDQQPQWQSSPSASFTFDTLGSVFINVRARNDDGESGLQRVEVNVVDDLVGGTTPGAHSSQLACNFADGDVWAVNPNNDTVTVFDTEMNKLDELGANGTLLNPQSVAQVNQNDVWVSAKDADSLFIFDASSYVLQQTIDTGYGSAPSDIVADDQYVYVSFYGAGEVRRYSVANPSAAPEVLKLAPTVKAMALSPDGSTLLVARFISDDHWGEVYSINTANWQLTQTYRLEKHLIDDQLDEGRGLPNYLASLVINGEGKRAYIVAKKDNVDRGLLNGNQDLDDDNTLRTMVMTLDLEAQVELKDQRLDLDNTSSLSAITMSQDSQYLLIAMQGKNSVLARSVDASGRIGGTNFDYAVGLAPQGVCVDGHEQKLYVKNFTERSVTQLDLSDGLVSPASKTASTVSNEKLSANELVGLQVFYNAFNGLENAAAVGKMSAEGYISCASCHADGGHDGRTWDLTGRGEGLRNSISLQGRSGVRFGNVHWSANFDEIHDFEHDIRGPFGGTGLLTDAQFVKTNTPLGAPKKGLNDELDQLAAYVSSLGKESLGRSPFKDSATDAVASGRALFEAQGCADCHSGSAMTDAELHNVGTLRAHSGQRLSETLEGIKTPSLLGLFATAPYLHDGSAKTIADVFTAVGGSTLQAEDVACGSNCESVSQNDYSYLRNGGGVRLNGNGATFSQSNIDGGDDGQATLRVRYGSAIGADNSSGGRLRVLVNGEEQRSIDLEYLPQVEGSDALFTETETISLTLEPGASNVVLLAYAGGEGVIIDEITLGDSELIAQAEPHLKVAQLSTDDQQLLGDYLLQLDTIDAPDDSVQDVFSNDTNSNNPGNNNPVGQSIVTQAEETNCYWRCNADANGLHITGNGGNLGLWGMDGGDGGISELSIRYDATTVSDGDVLRVFINDELQHELALEEGSGMVDSEALSVNLESGNNNHFVVKYAGDNGLTIDAFTFNSVKAAKQVVQGITLQAEDTNCYWGCNKTSTGLNITRNAGNFGIWGMDGGDGGINELSIRYDATTVSDGDVLRVFINDELQHELALQDGGGMVNSETFNVELEAGNNNHFVVKYSGDNGVTIDAFYFYQ